MCHARVQEAEVKMKELEGQVASVNNSKDEVLQHVCALLYCRSNKTCHHQLGC